MDNDKAREDALVIVLGEKPNKNKDVEESEYVCPVCSHEGAADEFKAESEDEQEED